MKKIYLTLLLLAVVTAGGFWTHKLKVAHSTFENYYAFRGCVELVERAESSATCRTSSGEEIKIVEIDGKWYLEGDGPGVW
jgi:hypothetical protein